MIPREFIYLLFSFMLCLFSGGTGEHAWSSVRLFPRPVRTVVYQPQEHDRPDQPYPPGYPGAMADRQSWAETYHTRGERAPCIYLIYKHLYILDIR